MIKKIPPYLKTGDEIALIAPAGYMAFEKIQACIDRLQEWGYSVLLGDTTHSNSETYFSGTDEERINDLQQFLDNPSVRAIICVRGGYGLSRMIDRLNFRKFKKHPKWIIGFSDVTVLHAHIHRNYGIASLHAPMANAFNGKPDSDPYIKSLKHALEGTPASYECDANPFNKTGEVKGELIGGNLSLLAHLCGTASDIKTKNRILFLEDIGEQLYNIDRMMIQLKRSGKFDRLKGLIIGGFTDCKDTERPFGKSVYQIIKEHVAEYKYPVCFDFPVSHEEKNYALKCGVAYQLSVGAEKTLLEEIK
jgi:muramoyltetrapeptide carboxypeptidase